MIFWGSNNNDKTTIEMQIYCLEGKGDDGTIIYRVFTHLSGCYERLAHGLADKRSGFSSLHSRILSIEDVLQITNKGGQYLKETTGMAESPNSCGLSLFAVEMMDGAPDVKLWGPNLPFVGEFERRYRDNN